jgi:hypothetical protein
MLVPFENVDDMTCEDVVSWAEAIDEDSAVCSSLKMAEALCCPSAASTCSICKGTKLLADVEIVDYVGATFKCSQTAYYAANLDETSAECTSYLGYEASCCPDVFTSFEKSIGIANQDSSTMIINSTSLSIVFPPR